MRIWGTGILKSLYLSLKQASRGTITVQYPKERITLPERARWAVAMKYDEAGEHKCTGCLVCEKACPDYVIHILMTTGEDRSKQIDHWRYEIGACMMCGLCVEACPFDAIRMSHEYELARIEPESLTIDLLTDVPVAKPKRERPEGAAPRPVRPAAEAPAAEVPAAEAPAPETEAPAPADAEKGGGDE